MLHNRILAFLSMYDSLSYLQLWKLVLSEPGYKIKHAMEDLTISQKVEELYTTEWRIRLL